MQMPKIALAIVIGVVVIVAVGTPFLALDDSVTVFGICPLH